MPARRCAARRSALLGAAALACFAAPALAGAQGTQGAPAAELVLRVAAAFDSVAALDVWPGFDARRTPLAIFDGAATWLVRHPAPPPGFAPHPGRPGLAMQAGRHPAVTANSSAEIGGVATATLMPGALGGTPREAAAVALHEAFHVFQRARHPSWQGNEVDLFTYPVADAAALAGRRRESLALARALAATDAASTACWTRAALDARRARFARLGAAAATYERRSELNEGLARHVEQAARGDPDGGAVTADDFPAAAVRDRVYASGHSLALLLDRLRPGWKGALAAADTTAALDALLAGAVGDSPAAASCAPTAAEAAALLDAARRDSARVVAERADRRRAFDGRAGWRLRVVAAPGAPLWPQRFDPLNVHPLDSLVVLHARHVRLGNDAGAIEALDAGDVDVEALSEGVGPHPLFDGVHTVTVAGLVAEPVVEERDGMARITAPGLTVELRGATVQRAGRVVTVRLR